MEEWTYSSTIFLISAVDGCEWSASYPGCFASADAIMFDLFHPLLRNLTFVNVGLVVLLPEINVHFLLVFINKSYPKGC
jgi:hypothetical protein